MVFSNYNNQIKIYKNVKYHSCKFMENGKFGAIIWIVNK